jgi:hypothetical protein
VSWRKMSANCILFKEKGFVSGTPAFGTKATRDDGGGGGDKVNRAEAPRG